MHQFSDGNDIFSALLRGEVDVIPKDSCTSQPEVQFPQNWEEHAVKVDREEILKVLRILRGKWVHRPVVCCMKGNTM